MSKTLKLGDQVESQTSQGKTSGVVKKKLTSKTKIKTHVVAAAKKNPEYLVQSKKSGGVAAHKPRALKKKSR
ncbi:MAG: DUF2945 domain-containing protein [Chthoniobacterales bacterium]